MANVAYPFQGDSILVPPGVHPGENMHPGAAVHTALPPEHPSRAEKGDLGEEVIAGMPSRPSFESPGVPFANLRRR